MLENTVLKMESISLYEKPSKDVVVSLNVLLCTVLKAFIVPKASMQHLPVQFSRGCDISKNIAIDFHSKIFQLLTLRYSAEA